MRAFLPWVGPALGALGILYGMIGYWARGYDSRDRAIIIVASAWLVWSRRKDLLAISDTPWPKLGTLLAIIGAVAYLPPWFVFTQIGPRPIILWWEAIALFIATVGVILLRSGPNLLNAVRFSLIFPLFALPLPGRIQNPFQEILQGIASSIGAEIIPLFGVPVIAKSGNEIRLPNSGVDVVGACSGLTQVRAILAVAAFIAHLRGFGPGRGLLTLLFAVPTLVFINSLRVAFSGLIQEWTGSRVYIEGMYHELLGLALFVIGLSIVMGFSRLLMQTEEGKQGGGEEDTGVSPLLPTSPSPLLSGFATVVLLLAAIAGLSFPFLPGLSRSQSEQPDFLQVKANLGTWKGTDPGMREYDFNAIRDTLTFNTARVTAYESSLGEKAHAWLIYWKSAMVVKDYHSPDVCNSKHGDTVVASAIRTITTPEGRTIPITYREVVNGDTKKMVMYWTQEGRKIWTDEDEARCASFLFPFHWARERLTVGRDPDQTDDRLVVYIGMPLSKYRSLETQRKALEDLAGKLGDELYRVAPWADPK